MRIPIDQILAGERTRDHDNISFRTDALIQSIRAHGLIQPVAVEDIGNGQYRLLAGGRRLAAVRALGHAEIVARVYDTPLTDTQRLEIEEEENEQRVDWTEVEKSRHIVRKAEAARTESRREAEELRASVARNPMPGRPMEPGSYRDIEKRTGYDQSSIRLAEQHIEALSKYEGLVSLPKTQAVHAAKLLDQLGPEDRQKFTRWGHRFSATDVDRLGRFVERQQQGTTVQATISPTPDPDTTRKHLTLVPTADPDVNMEEVQRAATLKRLREIAPEISRRLGQLDPKQIVPVMNEADIRNYHLLLEQVERWTTEMKDAIAKREGWEPFSMFGDPS